MSNASKKAYHSKPNILTRSTHREIINQFFLENPNKEFTIREVANRIHLTYNQTQKRISELKGEAIEEAGEKKEGDNTNSTYRLILGQVDLFKEPKKLSRYMAYKKAVEELLPSETIKSIEVKFNDLIAV